MREWKRHKHPFEDNVITGNAELSRRDKISYTSEGEPRLDGLD